LLVAFLAGAFFLDGSFFAGATTGILVPLGIFISL
jgi:hypothetical protein